MTMNRRNKFALTLGLGLLASTGVALLPEQSFGECNKACSPGQRDPKTGCCPAPKPPKPPKPPTAPSAAHSTCPAGEHDSGGHCCQAGKAWVPEKAQCICLDAGGCKAATPPDPPASPCPSAPLDMVLLGGGQFATSVDDGSLAPLPARTFTVPAFCMAKTETTVKDYQACVTAGQCKPAPTSNVLSIDAVEQLFCNGNRPDRQDHPVNCENWQMADAYCKWAGSRLPTELEWAYAAQASAGNKYPWGNAAPDETRLNACGSECKKQMASLRKINLSTLYSADDGWATTAPVAAFPGDATPTGVHGLAGNVGEWTASDYVFDYSEFSGSKCSMWCAVRGGAWDSVMPSDVEGAVRTPFLMIRGASSVGFRCARTR